MGRIFKIGLLSLEWQWRLLALNIPIFFKENMKKTKTDSIKNIWMVITVLSQNNTYMLLRITNCRKAII